MDACRSALRMPGCEKVKVVYRRGPDEIPARKDELEGAIKEEIEFVYNTQQVSVASKGNGLALTCVKTEPGEPDPEDGRRRPVVVEGSEHEIDCGMVIAAVGQQAESAHLAEGPDGRRPGEHRLGGHAHRGPQGLRRRRRRLRRLDHRHGHEPRPARRLLHQAVPRTASTTPALPHALPHAPGAGRPGHHVGALPAPGTGIPRGSEQNPAEFPEIETGYDDRDRQGRGGALLPLRRRDRLVDYSVAHREDIFSMARTNPLDSAQAAGPCCHAAWPAGQPVPGGPAGAPWTTWCSCPPTCRGSSSIPTARPAGSMSRLPPAR